MRMKSVLLSMLVAGFAFTSCSKKEKESVDPTDSNALQSVLVVPGGTLQNGNPPPPSGGANAPQIFNTQSTAAVNAGGQVSVPFSYSSNSGYTRCYVQVDGATNGYFDIPQPSSNPNQGQVTIPINVPSNVSSGDFCVLYCIQDGSGNVSQWQEICVNVTGTSSGGGGGTIGSGTFKIGSQNYTGAIVQGVPTSTGGTGVDVVFASQSGASVVLYNVPTASSGSFNIVEYAGGTERWLYATDGSYYGTSLSGSMNKTGAKSISFSATVEDINTGATRSVTGNGTWQ